MTTGPLSISKSNVVNSDVIVAEILIFVWYSFFTTMRQEFGKNLNALREILDNQDKTTVGEFRAARAKVPTEDDKTAIEDAMPLLADAIRVVRAEGAGNIWKTRFDMYEKVKSPRALDEKFVSIILGCTEKQTINDPDTVSLKYETLNLRFSTAIWVRTMLPSYFEVYKNIVEHCDMGDHVTT